MEEDKSLKKNDKSEDTDDDDDHDSSQIEIGSTIKSDKQESTDDEQENEKPESSDQPQDNNDQSNGILQTIGKWLLAFFMGIITGLFGFIKSNWIILLVLGGIIFAIYYVYSNAMNFLSSFTDIFKTIQPLIASTSAMLDSTAKKDDTKVDTKVDRIDSLSKSDNDKPSLETTLKAPVASEYKNLDDDVSSLIEDIPDSKVFVADNLVSSQDDEDKSKTGIEGYCFIGSDNDVRTCAPVGKNNKCMSGDIFPSLEICMDPKLRE